ncbi:FERM domain-containing protein 4B isoform X2 [Brienomyrus brachyistius]|uniref:FERM domain-containing protein 4B isoform X2 n=1 Tax=Brienomyrus brachyistius TaxID=42636 RepID=UPI0020B2E9D0|nr:FERM domain-containing protein 4B isoform X2 [Brienomyrus brachyistius]
MALGFMCGAEDLLLRGGRLVWGLAERALREWYESGLGPCQRFVQRCHRYQMTEGRLCQVHLLDDRKLELMVQPKLLSRELLDLVSSHFNLKEKEYFGITYTGDTGQCKWLQLDRRVLDHDFSKRTGPISLKFLVRFYIENFSFLKENTTVELFFLNAKASVYNGDIEVESEDVFKLAAYALQEAKGDYTSDENTRSDLKKLPTLPTRVLKEHPSLAYCEDRAIEHYKALKGLTRGQAVIQYLTLVESLPTYGVHYYEVKDKQGIPWWLGISYKGIGQYDLQDRLKPRKLFQWKQLENLYFREKKFAVEVHDPHRRTVTRRTFGQAGLVIHTWYATHSLIKSIWVMAISQHQFYLDRKQSKVKINTARSLGDIAMDLTESGVPRGSKLGITEGKDRLIMASNGSLVSAGSMDSEVNEEHKKEKISELKRKERELQGILDKKMEELKKICLREAELTGKLPKEYPLSSGEKTPQVRKRVGTTFKLDDVLNDQDPYLKNLEGRFSLQQKIVEAAKKLAAETEPCKTVKRKRKRNLLDAMRMLQEIENEINEHQIKMGKKPTQRVSLLIADETLTADLTSLDSLTLEDGEPAGTRRQRSRSVQYSPQSSNGPSSEYQQDRRASANEQHHDVGLDRLAYANMPEPYYSHRDALSTHSSPCKPSSRQARDSCSMPPTPVMPRNAFSSIQLRSDDGPQPFRHRSGSLESQSQHASDVDPYQPGFTLAPSRRSNSTEILDDGSSYTSQSSLEYSAPSGGAGSRTRDRWRHRKGNVYASAGSMPNLAQSDSRCYGYMPQACHTPTAFYVTGFPRYVEPEPYANGGYVYEAETEGHYNVNPSYPAAIYHGHDRYGRYGDDEADGPPQNLYATLRPPRSRPTAPPPALRPELMARNIQRALVEEHLRGWYNRSLGSKQAAHAYERGSQQSLSPQAAPPPFGHASRTVSYSSVSSAVSSRTWRGLQATGLPDYEVGVTQQQQAYPGSYSAVHGRFSSCRSPECQRRGPFVPDSPSSSASSSSSSSMLSSLLPSSPSSTGHRLDRRNKHAYAKFSPR